MNFAASARYSAVARIFHWVIALAIIANLVSGIGHEALDREARAAVMGVHISLGITILALSLLRLVWRLGHKPPPLPAGMTGWQIGLAHAAHWGFYLLMILVPLLGWIMVSSAPFPITWFGLFELPKFAVVRGDLLSEIGHEGHEILGFAMLGLLVLHVVAALWHQFLLKDNLLARMR